MTEYTTEQVEACIAAYRSGDLNYCRTGIIDLLTAYAERIKAVEGAVPVATDAQVEAIIKSVHSGYGIDESSWSQLLVRAALESKAVAQPLPMGKDGDGVVPALWIEFTDDGQNIRLWTRNGQQAAEEIREGRKLLAFYARPPAQAMNEQSGISGQLEFRKGLLEGLSMAKSECDNRVFALDGGDNQFRREATASQCAEAIRLVYARMFREMTAMPATHPPAQVDEVKVTDEAAMKAGDAIAALFTEGFFDEHMVLECGRAALESVGRPPAQAAQPTTNSPETDSTLVGEVVAQGEALDRAVLAYRMVCTSAVEGHNHRAGLAAVLADKTAQPATPHFRNANALADWLESLHECHADGAVGSRKWEPAQIAAKAVRESAQPAERVVEGMVLVPRVATAAMRLAMAKADDESGDRYRLMAAAMLTAAQQTDPVPAAQTPRRVIELTPAEIQSGLDRVRWAEGLIRQLPEDHDGRNSWLLNYAAQQADR